MSLFITSLNSGSNGNCYYIANKHEAVLIDIGLSCRETETRMKRLGLSMQKVKAVFISHEHSDHIRGVEIVSKKYNLPVYITETTYSKSGLRIEKNKVKSFSGYEPVSIGGMKVLPFPKLHDAADPYSFIVSGNGVNIGVLTDLGTVCEDVKRNFKLCNAVFLETNYDENMLDNGNYPFHLKRRIKADTGHLSNDQALSLFLEHKSPALSHVFLSHLSKDNNSPELARDLFLKHAGKVEIVVASRYAETDLYQIDSNGIKAESSIEKQNRQMKLFS